MSQENLGSLMQALFGKAHVGPVIAGLVCVTLFVFLISRGARSLFYYKFGNIYLGFLGVGVITVMDVMTSIFYAPAEAFRYLGYNSLFFITFTAILIALYAFSMTEIAQILEKNKIIGGGVYNFSYLVFGRNMSLIAASSIIVDYVNTAAISSISAVENMASIFAMTPFVKIILELLIIWFVTFLNIIGIKENVKTTYALFVFVCYVIGVTIALGISNVDAGSVAVIKNSIGSTWGGLGAKGLVSGIELVVIGVGSTILAYSGIESVLQTHKVVEDWKVIRKSYIFLIAFIGIVTPTISYLAISQVGNPGAHTGDLVTFYASMLGGRALSLFVVLAAMFTLAFAANTSMIAGVELMISISERFGVSWLKKTNRFGSHYVIILFMAIFFSLVILVTQGNQNLVADMYAIGLVATFVINLAGLITYRFFEGFARIKEYRTGLIKNILLLILFIGSFIFIFIHKKYGAMLWVGSGVLMVVFGIIATKFFRNPELEMERKFDNKTDVENYIKSVSDKEIHIRFVRGKEDCDAVLGNSVYVTFGLQRIIAPSKTCPNHFVLSANYFWSVNNEIEALLAILNEKFPERVFFVHLGWPSSSWVKRLYMGAVIHHLLKLPRRFTTMHFIIEHKPAPKH